MKTPLTIAGLLLAATLAATTVASWPGAVKLPKSYVGEWCQTLLSTVRIMKERLD
jgi:hypothetical protein